MMQGEKAFFFLQRSLEGRYPIGEIADFGISQTFEGLYNYQNSKYADAFPESVYPLQVP